MHLSPHEADDMCPHDHQNGVPSAPESLVTPPAPWPLRAPQPRPSIKSTLPDRNYLSSADAKQAIVLVTVYQKTASLEVSPDSVSLATGDTATLTARIMDANGHDIQLADAETDRADSWCTGQRTTRG